MGMAESERVTQAGRVGGPQAEYRYLRNGGSLASQVTALLGSAAFV